MPQTPFDTAKWFARCTPNCTPGMVADFMEAVDNIGRPYPLAQDSAPLGGSAMAYPRRTARDQNDPQPQGGYDPLSIDQEDPEGDPGQEMSPETLLDFVKICKNRLAANDDNGEGHNKFMNLLGQMVAQHHQDGMVNGDRAKRAARDNGPGRSTPAGGMSSFTGRGSMDRRAMDSAIAVRGLNAKSFLKRFPEAKASPFKGNFATLQSHTMTLQHCARAYQ
jgi:hypothetical protein